MSYRWKILARIAFTLVLLLVLVYQMDLKIFVDVMTSADVSLILLATVIHFVVMGLFVIRWQIILRNFEIFTRLVPLIKITLIGFFFNLFLPTGIGGDCFRAYYLARLERRGMSTTLTTTLLERSAGMCGLVMIGTCFAILGGIEFEGVSLVYVFLFVLILYVLGNMVLFNSQIHKGISHFLQKKNFLQMQAKMELVYKGLTMLRRNKRSVAITLTVSLTMQFLAVVIVWVSAQALRIDAPFMAFLTLVPLINLSVMVPLTINGIGLREGLFYLLFSQIGVPVEAAVSLSIIYFCIHVFSGLPGGIIYSLYEKKEPLDEIFSEASFS